MPNGREDNPNEETIEVIRNIGSGAAWRPIIGPEALDLLENSRLPTESRRAIQEEAISVLRRCISPSADGGADTGLVIGYVQSGKTMSFTAVAALARDNGYPIVIVIAGTSIPLTNQSQDRLYRDLRLGNREDRKWLHIHNPRGSDDARTIADTLLEWVDTTVPEAERRTVLITVMKHHVRLGDLINVLRQVRIENVPVLIVDDEADQTGLNNLIKRGEESTTYRRLCALKRMLPHHTFLQYTATPQGPLLINIIDVLSPDFACVLTPGPDYVGGQEFFLNNRNLVRDIPQQEIPTEDRQLQEPPASLTYALHIFFLGVAIGLLRDGGRGNRSMMVHPSQKIMRHGQYHLWIVAIRESWMRILQNQNDPDYSDLLNDFRGAYADLARTIPNIESFERIVTRLLHAIRITRLHLINTSRGRTPQIDWRSSYSHILVGGQAMDRGFTVEGLTVTYMPRGAGSRTADTIQQRGRFFGYKRGYLGFCRVFLESDVADAFRRYVEHEEDIRQRLLEFSANARPLSELRRIFLLSRALRPTRDTIIDIDYVRASFNEGWFYPRSPQDSPDALSLNRRIVEEFLQGVSLTPDAGHPDRTPIQRHLTAQNIRLDAVYESLLTNLRFASLNDAQDFLGVLVIINKYLADNPEATCSIYQMSQGLERERTLNSEGEILNLFQGAYPVNPPERRGAIYPGDMQIRSENGVTIQIHRLSIRDAEGQVIQNVPNIAVYIPRDMARDIIIQDQGRIE